MSAALGGSRRAPASPFASRPAFASSPRRARPAPGVRVKLPPIRIDLAVAERDRLVARHVPSSARGGAAAAPLDTPRPGRRPKPPGMELGGGFLSPRAPPPRAQPHPGTAAATARDGSPRRWRQPPQQPSQQPRHHHHHRSAARQIRVAAPPAAY
jgi:hypothetical protein